MSSPWFVYILGCRDGSYYTGATVDIPRRLSEHNSPQGGSRYTRTRQPVQLLAAWEVAQQSQALQIEHYIKHQLERKQKEALIANPDLLSEFLSQTQSDACFNERLRELRAKMRAL